ncbi:hypothetical protein N7E02_01065 (plasmid) [Aliirhizobium terrae]|nr:hypothetical protein [Rhizobium sp. CC-CFT758]WJH38036.1 hypothetical protein N7E02_01065 [Rhizobium sp. CC-CFT758]
MLECGQDIEHIVLVRFLSINGEEVAIVVWRHLQPLEKTVPAVCHDVGVEKDLLVLERQRREIASPAKPVIVGDVENGRRIEAMDPSVISNRSLEADRAARLQIMAGGTSKLALARHDRVGKQPAAEVEFPRIQFGALLKRRYLVLRPFVGMHDRQPGCQSDAEHQGEYGHEDDSKNAGRFG